MRTVLCALLALSISCSDEHRPGVRDAEVGRDADVGEDARVTPPRDASIDRDAGQPPGDCKPAKLDEIALLLYESSDDGRAAMPISTAGSVQFDGIVTARGSGIPMFDVGPMGVPAGDASQYRFVRIAVPGMLTRTIITRGLPDLPVREGAHVYVQLKSSTLGFGPIQQWLVMYEDAALAFFYGQDGALERLPDVKGFRFRVGQRACTLKNDCGDVGSFALSATLPTGAFLSLEPGQRLSRDGFVVTHHETRALLAMSSCPDYSPAQTRLMVERDAIPTHQPFDCVTTAESDLPGVHVEFPEESCMFSLAQARNGVDLHFSIVVDRDIADVAGIAPDAGHCQVPDPGMLAPRVTLSGNRQFYGIVDVGGCGPEKRFTRGTLRRGTYPGVLHWEGHNWFGPSDTFSPVGAAFPAGLYTLTVTANGYVGIPDDDADSGTGARFTLGGTRRIVVTD